MWIGLNSHDWEKNLTLSKSCHAFKNADCKISFDTECSEFSNLVHFYLRFQLYKKSRAIGHNYHHYKYILEIIQQFPAEITSGTVKHSDIMKITSSVKLRHQLDTTHSPYEQNSIYWKYLRTRNEMENS